MARRFNLRFRSRSAGTDVSTSGEIPETDWDRLMIYANEVVDLEQSEVIRRGLRVRIKLSWDAASRQLRYEGDLPSDDEIAALLHRLRPFVLQDETANFYRIVNTLSRYLNDGNARDFLRLQRDAYSGKSFQRQMRIGWKSESTQSVINSDETLVRWLNAHEYHRDKEKQEEIKRYDELLPPGVTRAIFVSMLLDKIKAIGNVAVVIRMLARSDGVPLDY